MRLLELFKGTGSIGKWCEKAHPDWDVVSLDILPKFKPTICSDIMDWDYKTYPTGYFDIIWASPECKVYSTLQHSLNINRWGKTREEAKANLEKTRREHDKYVLRVLDIIEYFKPAKWFIENPWNSNMKSIPQLKALKSYRFDYCRFGFDYQKPTRIWSNVNLEDMKCNCFPKPKKPPNKHKVVTMLNKDRPNQSSTSSTEQRYQIPEPLVDHLIDKESKPKNGHKVKIGIDPCSKTVLYDGPLVKANTKIPAYQIPEPLVEHLIDDDPVNLDKYLNLPKKKIGRS